MGLRNKAEPKAGFLVQASSRAAAICHDAHDRANPDKKPDADSRHQTAGRRGRGLSVLSAEPHAREPEAEVRQSVPHGNADRLYHDCSSSACFFIPGLVAGVADLVVQMWSDVAKSLTL